jgi:hypothetical protein
MAAMRGNTNMLLRVKYTVLGGKRVPASFTVEGHIFGALDGNDSARPVLRIGNKRIDPNDLHEAEYEILEATPEEALLLLRGGFFVRGIVVPDQARAFPRDQSPR